MDDTTPANTSCYDMIIGRDLIQALGFIIDFNDHTMTWDEATIPMKEYGKISTLAAADAYRDEIFITDIEQEITTRMTRILVRKGGPTKGSLWEQASHGKQAVPVADVAT